MCLVGYGERNCGKTAALFGDAVQTEDFSLPNVNRGISYQLLSQLYQQARLQPGITTLAVSAWVIKGSQIIEYVIEEIIL